jgi:hypothetical protein
MNSRKICSIISLFSLAAFLAGLSGCGLILGNVKPLTERSETYGIADLALENPSVWMQLSSTTKDESQEVPDVAFQSAKTSSIISLNSACRPKFGREEQDLKSFSDQLFLGISDVTLREEKQSDFQRSHALETTIQGKLNGEPMMLRTVVLRNGNCLYDLMYIARPEVFDVHEKDFSHFVASLRLR